MPAMFRLLALCIFLAAFHVQAQPTITNTAVGTAFRYQGALRGFFQSGQNSGPVQFRFGLWSDSVSTNAESQVSTNIIMTLNVSNNFFSTMLDFGDVFDGRRLFLDVAVWANTNIFLPTNWVTVSPRSEIGPVPYAMWAEKGGSMVLRAPSLGDDSSWEGTPEGVRIMSGGLFGELGYYHSGLAFWEFEGVSNNKSIDSIRVQIGAVQAVGESYDQLPPCMECSGQFSVEVWQTTNQVINSPYNYQKSIGQYGGTFLRGFTRATNIVIGTAPIGVWMNLPITNSLHTLKPGEVLHLTFQPGTTGDPNYQHQSFWVRAEAIVHDVPSDNSYAP